MEAAQRSGDQRLMALAKDLQKPKSVKGKFAPIIKSIEKMIKQLKKEENQDLETKQTCEDDRMENTRKAITNSREIDEKTDEITALDAKIAECQKTIKDLEAAIKKTQDELKAATKVRKEENAEFKKTDADDKAAAETVANAKDALASFYKKNGLNLLQKEAQPVSGMKAGEAPPPPPPTFEGGYGGKTGESQGIIAIMDMVREDILKDRADAKADEDASQKEFDAFKKDSNEHIKELQGQKRTTNKDMGRAESKRSSTKTQRTTQKGKLNGILKKIQDINPNCEYYEVNYPMRRENRQIEMDGLEKAKAILQGGKFD